MQLLKKGMRLSIQPVTQNEFDFIVALDSAGLIRKRTELD
jgi:predicted RNA-binding protein with PUA-like domain